MVRGPSALLAACLGTLAYLLAVPALPDLDGDVSVLVGGGLALALLGALGLSLVGLRDAGPLVALLGLGGALIAAAMTAAGVGAAADVPKAIFAAALGTLLAQLLATPVVLVAVPVFVAAVVVWSVSAGPATKLVEEEDAGAVEFAAFVLPAWGGGEVGRLGLSDVVFLAFFAALAWRYRLRGAVTAAALVGALVLALVAQVATDTALPVLPFLAAALLAPNVDRIARLLRGSVGE